MSSLPTITLREPFATLVARGVKRYETRSWATEHRGVLLVHASAGYSGEDHAAAVRLMGELSTGLGAELMRTLRKRPADSFRLTRGHVLAVAWLAGCHLMQPGPEGYQVGYQFDLHDPAWQTGEGELQVRTTITQTERRCGYWDQGRYAWELQHVQLLPQALPAKGALQLWRFEPPERHAAEVVAAVERCREAASVGVPR